MNELLQPGWELRAKNSGRTFRVLNCLGGGGQGEVYRVDYGGQEFAVKWYYPQTATDDQLQALNQLTNVHLAPSDQFLWPLDIAEDPRIAGFGYLMRLRDRRYRGLTDLMANRVDPTLQILVTAGLHLVNCFHKLHSAGLCYCDISFGNAFFDPKSGEILVCDNDNVRENRPKKVPVLGTPDFMAPEIIRGEALPSRTTDLYSLSVLLFYMFFTGHPLMGKRILSIRSWDYPARKRIFGDEPLFIFDPADSSNEAVDRRTDPLGEAGVSPKESWLIYPSYIRAAFTRSFTTGIFDPEHGRILESEWRGLLSRLRDAVTPCSHCGLQNFYEESDSPRVCWSCNKTPKYPFRLRISRTIVMLPLDGKLHPHQLDDRRDFDFETVWGEVVRNPADERIWGLRNQSPEKWVATFSDGQIREVEPGKSLRLADGVRINFGRVEGVLQC